MKSATKAAEELHAVLADDRVKMTHPESLRKLGAFGKSVRVLEQAYEAYKKGKK